ncbi:selenium metabolism-associated LysR family transcriptional regulator [Neobacillus mesonae]|uniref:selenium metabolism-associated LysR family transcriptional regulator n=1 Tax=Neobacillus mesonae TaxID=1193713 RepID=UPI002041609E|nr:selenium metabolism-associated LysR family transcriptional regulator [Neobacillus mesonae]MCM3570384.1 selenium metabolism-associated LysR family transcriptional regulator [Neobacillus mesonae]
MNLEHLKVFFTAATKKNFSETAKILHLSQPSVSLHIKHLEEYLNTSLFDRSTKKMELTHAGTILYNYAEQLIQLVNQVEKDISLLSETIHGDLRLGASLTIGEYLLPYFLGDFIKKYPEVNISFKVDNSYQIIEQLLDGKIDLGFIEASIPRKEIDSFPFLEDELVIISSVKDPHPNLTEDTIEPELLFSLPIIVREHGSGTRQVLETNLSKHQLDVGQLHIIMEFENTESIKSAVESGMGVAIISKTTIQKELDLGLLKQTRIKGIPLKRYLYLIHRKQVLSPACDAFKELFISSLKVPQD